MTRDMEVIRTLLLKIEAYPMNGDDVVHLPPEDDHLSIPGVSVEQINYHLGLLKSHGLVASPNRQSIPGIVFTGLTWEGHDFIDSVRDDEIWRLTRRGAEQAGGWTFDIIRDLAKGLIKTQLKKYTGVEV